MRPRQGAFHERPFIVIWETTRACDLACVHCRATAQPDALPGELTHDEGCTLIDEVARMGTSVLVLSGGDPLKRADLCDLIRHAKAQGLRVGTIPAATPRLTLDAVYALKQAGVDQMALSLDASTAEAHDRFRGVPGAYHKTLQAAEWAHAVGVRLQINSVMTARNLDDIDQLIALVRSLGIVFWEVFFLVPTGRGTALEGLTSEQYEEVFAKLYELSRSATFILKITEAPHYRRYSLQRQFEEHRAAVEPFGPNGRAIAAERWRERGAGPIGMAMQPINAGNGHLFISCTGDVYPSGFLPVSAGNIRHATLRELYRTSALFRELRDPDLLKGRCGVCEYRSLCGGSRSRAYALTGDYLAEEPCCAYVPMASAPR